MQYDDLNVNHILNDIRKELILNYDKTKKILIIAERFGNVSNEYVFYNLFQILDQFYLLFNNTGNLTNYKFCSERLEKINSNFLIAQNYSLVIGIIGFLKIMDKNEKKKHSLSLEKLLIEFDLIDHESKNNRKLKSINEFEFLWHSEDLNYKLIEFLKNLIKTIDPNYDLNIIWKLQSINDINLKSEKFSEEYIEELLNVLLNKYKLSRLVLFDILRRTGSHYRFSITELRDALDHISKSLIQYNNENKSDSITEIIHASEHIRRAAVETVQYYCVERLNDFSLCYLNDNQRYSINLNLLIEIYDFICRGRYLKGGNTWCDSIMKFYQAIDLLEKVGENDST